MYDENNDMGLNNNSTGDGMRRDDQHQETLETNFVMRDAEPAPEPTPAPAPSHEPRREQYQDMYQSRPVYNHIPDEPRHEKKKSRRMAARVAGVTAAALLFGTVAGGTMFGVNYLGEHFTKETYPQVGQVTTATTAPASTNGGGAAINATATDVSSIVEQAMPSVVAITNTMLYQSNSFFGQTQTYEVPASGSGIIIGQNDSELLIVTNNHVVEDSNSLKVTFIDDNAADAFIKGTDPETDLAVIAVPLSGIQSETLSKISVAKLGNSDDLKVGQGVIAIGNALGYGQSVTVGYVSALNRQVKTEDQITHDLLQTDAAINPGNSGGALLNMNGEVIAINSAKYSSTDVEGMGYAIPISKAQDIINELMNKKTRTLVDEKDQGYLGIQGQNIDQQMADTYGMPRGIYVYKIVEGSAAANSGLKEKDVITKFDGQSVRSMSDLKELLTYYEKNTTVPLTVQSLVDGAYVERNVDITLGERTGVEK